MIYGVAEDEFKQIVAESQSYAEVFRRLGRAGSGAAYPRMRKTVREMGLSVEHFVKPRPSRLIPLSKVLVRGRRYNGAGLKKRLVSLGIFAEKCGKCEMGPEWQGEPITLHLDHINGVRDDNRLFNLRLLCPNCHSQTETWGAKRRKRARPKCGGCGKTLSKAAHTSCIQCSNKTKHALGKGATILWPPLPELVEMVRETNFCQVGLKLGVSDNAIRKHIRKRDPETYITLTPAGKPKPKCSRCGGERSLKAKEHCKKCYLAQVSKKRLAAFERAV